MNIEEAEDKQPRNIIQIIIVHILLIGIRLNDEFCLMDPCIVLQLNLYTNLLETAVSDEIKDESNELYKFVKAKSEETIKNMNKCLYYSFI